MDANRARRGRGRLSPESRRWRARSRYVSLRKSRGGSAGGPTRRSKQSPTRSTDDRERPSVGRPPPRHSTNSYGYSNKPVVRRSVEFGLGGFIGARLTRSPMADYEPTFGRSIGSAAAPPVARCHVRTGPSVSQRERSPGPPRPSHPDGPSLGHDLSQPVDLWIRGDDDCSTARTRRVKRAAINRGLAAGYSAARLRKRSSSDTGRRVPAALSSETTSCVRRSSRSASTKAISATIAVARRSWRARRPWTSSACHLIIRTGEFALAVAVREADGKNTESSPRTDPGPSVARMRPCLRTSTLPSRMAATPAAGSPSSKSVEPAVASLIVVSRLSWSMSSSTTSRNGHTDRIAAGRSAFKRVLRECRWDGENDPRTRGQGR